ncbi:MAG: hypothetical protein U0905_20200 [Pirellulales bacterium]
MKLTLSDRLRSVALVIERDLNGCTVRPVPPMNSTEITGYFEYYDGPMTDNSAGISSLAENRIGDGDDVLMFMRVLAVNRSSARFLMPSWRSQRTLLTLQRKAIGKRW